ncbi:MAG: acyl-CoA synthetase (AMP-forming)/AMP-acid ligase II [Natrialbaceae archaeon]|jgi:acyl-CoA synthetase (AMP-forming)/AMP-acid ligase II
MPGERPPDDIETIGDLLEENAAARGDSTFFRYRGESYTYEELDAKVNSVANELLAMGVSPGDTVCILLYNRPEYLYMLFALAKIGAIAVPVDTRFSGDTLLHVLRETDARFLVLDDDTRPAYEAIRGDVPNIGVELFVGEQENNQPYRSFDQLLDGDGSAQPDIEVDGSQTCSITYVQRYEATHPQGVMLPHYSYINTGWETTEHILNTSQDDCVFTTHPFYSCYPIQMGVVSVMFAGAEFAFEKQFQREQFWDWIRTYDATIFLYLGRMLSVLYNQGKKGDENPTEYVLGHGFGFDIDESLISDFEERFDITVLEAYGITPSATIATTNRPGSRKVGSVGKPLPYVDIKIVNENDWEVPIGNTGEILVRSNRTHTMMQQFYEAPELTVQTCQNQWIHTNDIGYIDEDGYLHFVANKAHSIHLGRVGGRISSLEIESVMDSHPDISTSVVIGVPDDVGNEVIKAIVVPRDDADLSPIDVSKHCEKRLTYHKLPRYIELRDELPRSPAGKVQNKKLRDTSITNGVWDRESGYKLSR